MADIYDPRSDFWKNTFSTASEYDTYISNSADEHARRWGEMARNLPAMTAEQVTRVTGYNRQLNVLLYSGAWCGDCVRQGPMIRAICDACGDSVTLRVIDRDVSPELQNELRICGGTRVPVVVFLSEDFFEVGRFGDRLLSAYRAKAERETGAACSTGLVAPAGDELAAELNDWVDVFERMLLMVRLSGFLRARHGD